MVNQQYFSKMAHTVISYSIIHFENLILNGRPHPCKQHARHINKTNLIIYAHSNHLSIPFEYVHYTPRYVPLPWQAVWARTETAPTAALQPLAVLGNSISVHQNALKT